MVKRFMDIDNRVYVPKVKHIEVRQLGIKQIVRVNVIKDVWRYE